MKNTNTIDQRVEPNKSAYNIKTIAARHTRHKSMLYNGNCKNSRIVPANQPKADNSMSSKTMDSKRHYAKPVVSSK
jgi:hypothetical protein